MATPAKLVPKEIKCIVCGQASHREDWQFHKAPACDSHTSEEIKAALAKLNPSPAPAVVKK